MEKIKTPKDTKQTKNIRYNWQLYNLIWYTTMEYFELRDKEPTKEVFLINQRTLEAVRAEIQKTFLM